MRPPPFHSSPPTVVGRKKEKAEPTAAQNLITNGFFILSLEGGRKERKKKNQPAAFAYSTHWRKMSAPVQIDHVIAARSQDHNTYTHTELLTRQHCRGHLSSHVCSPKTSLAPKPQQAQQARARKTDSDALESHISDIHGAPDINVDVYLPAESLCPSL